MHSSRTVGIYLTILLAVTTACSKEDAQQIVEQTATRAMPVAQQAVDAVQQAISTEGTIDLVLDTPVAASSCYLSLSKLRPNQPSILQLTSYPTAEAEDFPSVYVRADVSASEPSGLSERSAPAQMFVQPEEDGPVWYSAPGDSVRISVQASGDGSISVSLVGGTLTNSDTGDSIEVSGEFAVPPR